MPDIILITSDGQRVPQTFEEFIGITSKPESMPEITVAEANAEVHAAIAEAKAQAEAEASHCSRCGSTGCDFCR